MSFKTTTETRTVIRCDHEGCSMMEWYPGDREQVRERLAEQGWTRFGPPRQNSDRCPQHRVSNPPASPVPEPGEGDAG